MTTKKLAHLSGALFLYLFVPLMLVSATASVYFFTHYFPGLWISIPVFVFAFLSGLGTEVLRHLNQESFYSGFDGAYSNLARMTRIPRFQSIGKMHRKVFPNSVTQVGALGRSVIQPHRTQSKETRKSGPKKTASKKDPDPDGSARSQDQLFFPQMI